MIRPHPLLRVSAVVASLALLSACAQSVPPPTPGVEPMRGAALPPPERVPATSGTPAIGTEPQRGAPLPAGGSTVVRDGSAPEIGTEPMRGAPLPTSTDQTTRRRAR